MTDEQLRDLAFHRRSAAYDDKEKAVLLYAERMTRRAAAIRERALDELRQFFPDESIVELTLVVCVANFTNRFNDALQIAPDLG